MPAVSERQRRFMGAELARARKGKRPKTGMSEAQLSEFAAKPVVSSYVKASTWRRKRGR